MELYKNYPIHTTATSEDGRQWQGSGVVIDPQAKLIRELHRVQTVEDFCFLSKQEAEEFALKLCKAWIDR